MNFFLITRLFRRSKAKKPYIPPDRYLDFILWAYGYPLPETEIEKLEAWNSLHGKELHIDSIEELTDNLAAMFDMYLTEKETFYES